MNKKLDAKKVYKSLLQWKLDYLPKKVEEENLYFDEGERDIKLLSNDSQHKDNKERLHV